MVIEIGRKQVFPKSIALDFGEGLENGKEFFAKQFCKMWSMGLMWLHPVDLRKMEHVFWMDVGRSLVG